MIILNNHSCAAFCLGSVRMQIQSADGISQGGRLFGKDFLAQRYGFAIIHKFTLRGIFVTVGMAQSGG